MTLIDKLRAPEYDHDCLHRMVAAKEIERLREALLVLLVETDDSEYMTQREREEFARQALVPNA